MSGYVALLSFRYMNLCVKADIVSLLPVTIYADGQEGNIEEFANVSKPSEYQLGVYPKDSKEMQDIIQGIYEVHPEFKMEMKKDDDNDDEASQYILYTMPEVDKNRHDFLMNAVKGLYDECYARLDKIYADSKVNLIQVIGEVSLQGADEAQKALDSVNDNCHDLARDLLIQKQDEIEEAYQNYLKMMEEKKLEESEFDYTKGFRMYD
jgi:ribosome recycling factor